MSHIFTPIAAFYKTYVKRFKIIFPSHLPLSLFFCCCWKQPHQTCATPTPFPIWVIIFHFPSNSDIKFLNFKFRRLPISFFIIHQQHALFFLLEIFLTTITAMCFHFVILFFFPLPHFTFSYDVDVRRPARNWTWPCIILWSHRDTCHIGRRWWCIFQPPPPLCASLPSYSHFFKHKNNF